nr:MAG TPA: hypothetical protein [Caudoviricetes sp.]
MGRTFEPCRESHILKLNLGVDNMKKYANSKSMYSFYVKTRKMNTPVVPAIPELMEYKENRHKKKN